MYDENADRLTLSAQRRAGQYTGACRSRRWQPGPVGDVWIDIVEVGNVDLAILDIRLENDDDEKDLSGLLLVKEMAHSVPKIILTGFPSYETVRDALQPSLEGLPVAVNFVAKQEGAEAMLRAVRVALMLRDVFVVHGHDEAATGCS